MPDLVIQGADGVYLNVHVQAGAGSDRVVGIHGDALKVAVTAPPEGGRANRAVVEAVAVLVGVRRQDVEVASGARSRRKRLLIRGIDQVDVEAKIARALAR